MTALTTLPRGRIKVSPEDFVVEEIPAYEPSGAGSHLYVRFTKTDLTTPDALRAIARALGHTIVEPRPALRRRWRRIRRRAVDELCA